MSDEGLSCRYCDADVKPGQRRCHECDSWLSWRAFLFYPETLWTQISMIVSIAAAIVSWVHAIEARAEHAAAEAARRDVTDIAGHVTKLMVVFADGAKRAEGVPEPHLEQIAQFTEALLPHLEVDIKEEITVILRDLGDKAPLPQAPRPAKAPATPAPPRK